MVGNEEKYLDAILKAIYEITNKEFGEHVKTDDILNHMSKNGFIYEKRAIFQSNLSLLSNKNLIEGSQADNKSFIIVRLTRKGFENIQNKVSYTGVPAFYNKPLSKEKNNLELFLKELNNRLPKSGVGSRDYALTEKKIEQVKYKINRIESKALKKREIIYLIIAIIGAILGIGGLIIGVIGLLK